MFTQRGFSFRSARRYSVALVRGKFWKTFCSVLLWNLCYFAVLLLFLCIVTFAVLLVIRFTHSGTVLTSHVTQILRLLIQVVLWSFSFFSTPICMAHVTSLFETRCAERQEVAIPMETWQLKRTAKPFHNMTAILTAACLTVAALTLNISYLHSLATNHSTLLLTFYQDPTVMVHRGLSTDAPENTLYAFSNAVDAGADFIELDVQQTKDGMLVVLHDSNLKRTTGLDWNIWEVTYDEIADLDAGSWFDPAYANARIPTLEDTLRFLDGRITLNIEIKPTEHTTDTLEQDVVDCITANGYEKNCWVTSFSYRSLKPIKQINPEIQTGYIMSIAYGQFYSLQYADSFSLNRVFVTSQVVSTAHQYGKQAFT
ncbi:MAG: glycerophosphoryl diester phosphodiesterase membrane domain-containing protein [Ruminococcus sp.]|nr:glycerophosphoryl diester phosphodiesterase membrane domain-containing protein [Ruminococcus sp.]